MRRILKFTLAPITTVRTADVPRCLAVGVQDNDIVLWVEATVGMDVETQFLAFPTGIDAPEPMDSEYVGTAQLPGPLVFHVYRVVS